MPKEFVYCQDFGREVRLVSSDSDAVEFGEMEKDAVKVGWSKEAGHVELAVCQMVEGSFVEHGFLLEQGADIGTEEAVRLAHLTPRYIRLDRSGINHLIRLLRQARDDAYGRDE